MKTTPAQTARQPQVWKAWFEKYRPQTVNDIVFPDESLRTIFKDFYDNGLIKGNVLAYGPAGYGKTSLTEVFIHRIIKNRQDIMVLGRKVDVLTKDGIRNIRVRKIAENIEKDLIYV